jgi:hypothetical protein
MNYNRLQFQDLYEVILARKILTKADIKNKSNLQIVSISLLDLFQSEISLTNLEERLENVSTERFDTIVETISDSFSQLFQTEVEPHKKNINIIEYYNQVLEQDLNYLEKGDTSGLKPCIQKITVNKSSKLYSFTIEFIINDIIESIRSWFDSYFDIQTRMEILLKAGIKGSAPTFLKQSEFFVQKVKELQKTIGSNKVNISVSEWNLRLSIISNDEIDLLHPFNITYKDKALIPIFLEMNGIIDVLDYSIVSSVLYPSQIDLQFSVCKPSVNNVFDADTEFISRNIRKNLTDTQLVILDKTFDELRDSLILEFKPKLINSLPDLLIWLVKRIHFCLEEEGYLRNKAIEWYDQHKTDKYIKMEDDFFLPFIYEKLVDEFGNDSILKKPQKYKGEIDLLYKNLIPIELKVWINKDDNLSDSIDEKFPHSSQVAAYASENRVGILLVLNISRKNDGITNLENCWKTITKNFEINSELPTKIIASIFHCSYSAPSSYK